MYFIESKNFTHKKKSTNEKIIFNVVLVLITKNYKTTKMHVRYRAEVIKNTTLENFKLLNRNLLNIWLRRHEKINIVTTQRGDAHSYYNKFTLFLPPTVLP